MTRSEEEYRALAQRAAERLLKLPGVHTVGIGGRETAGQPTGEIVIKVFVEKKRPRKDLDPAAMVPAELEGLKTDVVQCPPFGPGKAVSAKPPFPDPAQGYLYGDRERERPVRGGTHLEAKDSGEAGTLGFLARVPTDPKRIMAVTNHHVLFNVAPPTIGRLVGQPEPNDSCTKCCRGLIGKCAASHFDSDVDAALVQLDPELEWLAEIKEIGFIRGSFDLTTAEAATLRYQLRMRGRTQGLVGGTLQAINAHGSAGGRTFTNGIVIKPNPDASITGKLYFGDFGDSGAALVNDDSRVVGLYASGPVTGPEEGFGKGFPIKALIDKFKSADGIAIEVATATKLGQVQKVPKAAAEAASALDLPPAVRRLEADLDRSARGRELVTAWLRHSGELNRLVNTNRRVGAAWRRANGPELFRQLMYAAEQPGQRLPHEIAGQPADVVLMGFLREVERHASSTLQPELARQAAFLASLPGRSYEEIVRELQ